MLLSHMLRDLLSRHKYIIHSLGWDSNHTIYKNNKHLYTQYILSKINIARKRSERKKKAKRKGQS